MKDNLYTIFREDRLPIRGGDKNGGGFRAGKFFYFFSWPSNFIPITLTLRRLSRIKGVGADQYMKSTGQLFETFTVKETVDELLAELAETIAYTNFIAIKVIALSNAIKDKQ